MKPSKLSSTLWIMWVNSIFTSPYKEGALSIFGALFFAFMVVVVAFIGSLAADQQWGMVAGVVGFVALFLNYLSKFKRGPIPGSDVDREQ